MGNMGSEMNPESEAHWTLKHLLGRQLQKWLERGIAKWCFFIEQCPDCDGGPVVENVLLGASRVAVEEAYGGFRPDITIWREAGLPPRIIEIVTTAEPTQQKLASLRKDGVDVFVLRAKDRQDVLAGLATALWVQNRADAHIVKCRKQQRNRVVGWIRLLDETPGSHLVVKQGPPPKDPEQLMKRWVSQQFEIAGKSASRDDFLNVVARISVGLAFSTMAWDGSGARRPYTLMEQVALDSLLEVHAVVRHQNGKDRETSDVPQIPVELPIGDQLIWDSLRDILSDVSFPYGRLMHGYGSI